MKQHKQMQVWENVTTKYICNWCGLEISKEQIEFDDSISNPEDEIHEIKISFGYYSFHDGETWTFDLCGKCIDKLVAQFLYPPKKEECL